MTYTLVLLRHGESDWNAKNLFTGWVDVHLTEKGRQEAVGGGEQLLRAVGWAAGRVRRSGGTRQLEHLP